MVKNYYPKAPPPASWRRFTDWFAMFAALGGVNKPPCPEAAAMNWTLFRQGEEPRIPLKECRAGSCRCDYIGVPPVRAAQHGLSAEDLPAKLPPPST